ncbi:protein FAR1-RELATED SEQUENCE 5-like [Wolffia australiana]
MEITEPLRQVHAEAAIDDGSPRADPSPSPSPGSPDPAVGMAFDSERAAFDFYNQHARRVGFSVRWDCKTVSRKTGLTIARLFVCSKQGFRGDGKIRDLFSKYHREDTRCGCPAFMKIKLAPDRRFHVSDCQTAHNHDLATASHVHMLRSQRPPAAAKRRRKKLSDGGDGDGDSAGEEEGRAECRTHLPGRRAGGPEKFELAALLEHFRDRQARDPGLFYAFQFDSEEQLANVLWADRRMRADLARFGDAVCLDATGDLAELGRPLALFLGVNQHRQLTVLAAALLYDESVESLRWALRALLAAAGGRMPVTLFTDEGEAVAAAAAAELPYAAHRLCAWQLYQRAHRALAHALGGSKTLDEDLCRCLFECEEEADFFEAWNAMLVKHGLFDNPWLRLRFEARERWAPPYARAAFSADLRSAQRADPLTRDLRAAVGGAAGAARFLSRLERFLDARRRLALEADFRMTQSQPHVPPVSLLRHAARVYTSAVFHVFMAEYVAGLECVVRREAAEGPRRALTVEDGRGREHLVRVDLGGPDLGCGCSCLRFESAGVLCGHVLACISDHVREIPARYVLARWTRAGVEDGGVEAEAGAHLRSRRYDVLVRSFVPALVRAAADEELFSCAGRHRRAMEEEMAQIAADKAAAGEVPGDDHAIWVV